MLTAAILFLSCCLNIHTLYKIRTANRKMDASHEALLAASRHLESMQGAVVVQTVMGDPVRWTESAARRPH